MWKSREMLVVPLFTSFTRPFLPFSASWMTLSSFLPSLLWIALSASGAVAVMSSAESVLLMETLPPPMRGLLYSADGRGVAGAGGGDGAAGYRDTAGVVVVAAADAGAGVIAGGCDGAATDGDIGGVAADARRTEVVAMLVAFGVDRAALDGHAAAAIKARADAGSGIAACCVDGAAVDHDVHLVRVIA